MTLLEYRNLVLTLQSHDRWTDGFHGRHSNEHSVVLMVSDFNLKTEEQGLTTFRSNFFFFGYSALVTSSTHFRALNISIEQICHFHLIGLFWRNLGNESKLLSPAFGQETVHVTAGSVGIWMIPSWILTQQITLRHCSGF